MSTPSPPTPPPSCAHGQCLCAAVRFTVTLPSKWCAHCHCTMCRRAHGAAFVTWFGVPAAAFRITQGGDRLSRFKSSAEAVRSFCGTCGSTMLFESSRWPGEVHVALANMLDAIDRRPTAHVYFDDHVDWITVDDALPKIGATQTAAGNTASHSDGDRHRNT